ncbi:MAG: TAXI family TRAP transporter solute-binding subunit [Cyanomargarita calcarea GSE-NOS-MK-12-04C]|jgi:TRAP transporter TAXI family solute receptor|uniref:TAXI family TRAP transporter solute-binding subunit n=1 Tax=Cyanomargarita calcarea GSE-NOS-MK-12-04C TaxID=2839659 RepID=A0A951QSR9_9CYAN|nr:TAXI family TRAP transporter solute-binding subunit [Cyanomargarita calcarea GSE-NOS-MK-12-04C]
MKLFKQIVICFCIGLIILACISQLPNRDECLTSLTVAAGLKDGDSYKFAKIMANLVKNNSSGKICLNLDEHTKGTEENLRKLKNNEAQLATAQEDVLIMKDFPTLQVNNEAPAPLPPSIPSKEARIVSMLFLDIYQLVVRADTGIKSVADLKSKRVAMLSRDGGQINSFAFLMQHYGLIGKDQQQLFELVDVSNDEKKALCDNKTVDAVFHVRVLGNPRIGQLLTDKKCNARLLTIDQAAAIKIKNPYLEKVQIPKGAYQGGNNPIPDDGPDNVPDYQKRIVTTLSVPRLLLAREDVDKEVIRKITEIIFEHQQKLVTEMPFVANMNSPENLKGIGLLIPMHPGAQAYFDREKPNWFEQHSGGIQLLLSLVSLLIGLGFWLWQQFEQIRKNKADDYIREVTALMDAEECVKAVFEYLIANKSNDEQRFSKFRNVITDKAAKILVEERVSELALSRKSISEDSRNSFHSTLHKVVNAIENIVEKEKIFDEIIQKTTILLDKQQEKEKLKTNLSQALDPLKTNTSNQQLVQKPSQFIECKSLEIRQDLEAIFKRAVNALVEERISQESFQSFRVIWQIAVGEVERESSRSS